MFWPDPTYQPTHPSTHPPNYTPTYGWGSLHRFQIFKQNWNISISSSAIEFWMIPGVGVGWMGVGGGERVHLHTCTCTCMHTYTCMTSEGIPRESPNGGCHLQLSCLMCICVCVCTCVGAPPTTTHPIHPPPNHPPPHPPSPPSPELQGARNTKIQYFLN